MSAPPESKDAAALGDASPGGFKAPAPKPKPMSVNVTGDSWSQKGHGLMLPPKPKLNLPTTSGAPPADSSSAPPAPSAPSSEPIVVPAAAQLAAASKPTESSVVEFKYSAPLWSPKTVLHPWSFEVLRNGASLGVQSLSHKGFLLVGRLPVCDIELEHDSVSRQHAVIQHRSTGQIYVYDLSSTHGTFVNKRKVKPAVYVPIKNGDMVRFGQTARVFVLQGGPDEDDETPPEQAQQRVQRRSVPIEKEEVEGEGGGGGGGGGGGAEGAIGKGESDVFTGNIADFKNFMKQQQEKHSKGKGKKPQKGAVSRDLMPELAKQARAAFRGHSTDGKKEEVAKKAEESESSSEDEDPLGLGIGGDGKKKRKKKEKKGKKAKKDEEEEPEDLEITKHGTVADEFYSSGEEDDDFYDRTKARGRSVSASGARALTPADIRAQIRDLEKRREDALFALHEAKATSGGRGRKDDDELDAYMANVKGTIEAQREKQLAEKLAELNGEHTRLNSLLALTQSALDRANPTNSTPISAPLPRDAPASSTCSLSASSSSSSSSAPSSSSTPTLSIAERRQRALDPTGSLAAYLNQFEKERKKEDTITPSEAGADAVPELTPDIEARLGTVRKKRAGEEESKDAGSSKDSDKKKKTAFVEKAEEVVTWVPPENQKGDGRTQLNEKFGY